jgi:hypothetical protein
MDSKWEIIRNGGADIAPHDHGEAPVIRNEEFNEVVEKDTIDLEKFNELLEQGIY